LKTWSCVLMCFVQQELGNDVNPRVSIELKKESVDEEEGGEIERSGSIYASCQDPVVGHANSSCYRFDKLTSCCQRISSDSSCRRRAVGMTGSIWVQSVLQISHGRARGSTR